MFILFTLVKYLKLKGRWAVKEALFKALSNSDINRRFNFSDVWLDSSKNKYILKGDSLIGLKAMASISHERDYVMAMVVVVRE